MVPPPDPVPAPDAVPATGAATAVAVLLKRVDYRPEVDPLSGDVTGDRHGGMSAADACALELALRVAEADRTGVLAVSAGGPDAEPVLRQALETGASRAVRVALDPEAPSADVADALAAVVRGCRWVWAGDYSTDRGSGSVPAFVAGRLGAAQALGAASVTVPPGAGGAVHVERRLDAGRREQLVVRAPAVVSVESGLALLRRPGLRGVLAARERPVETVGAPPAAPAPGRHRPFRPRPRVLLGPDPALTPHQRLLALSGALSTREPPRLVEATPEQAADELLAFLAQRGYLPDGDPA